MSETKEMLTQRKKDTKQRINDTYGWVRIAKKAVKGLPVTQFRYKVPKTWNFMEMKDITRHGVQAKNTRQRIMHEDIYVSAFIYMVAIIDDYMDTVKESMFPDLNWKNFPEGFPENLIEMELWERWQEIRQRRHVWVHNAGFADDSYVSNKYVAKLAKHGFCPKCNEKARLDGGYFDYATSRMKQLLEDFQTYIDGQ